MTLTLVKKSPKNGLPSSKLQNSRRFCHWASRINRPDLSSRLNPYHPSVYFSLEYGLPEMGYMGGLGILAADYVKQAVDLNYPAIFLGLAYSLRREEIFSRERNGDHWIVKEKPLSKPPDAGMTITLKDSVNNDWCIPVGRHQISNSYTQLLTLQVPGVVYPEDPWSDIRLANDIVLGFGGYKIIRQLKDQGIIKEPAFYHLNESATVFGVLGALDDLTSLYDGDYESALMEISTKTILTNHTLIPAAEARYTKEQCTIIFNNINNNVVKKHLEDFIRARGNGLATLDLAIYLASLYNGVSEYHSEIAEWAFTKQYNRPFTFKPVTNGIYLDSWNPEMVTFLKKHKILDEFGMSIKNPRQYAREIESIDPLDMMKMKKMFVDLLRLYLASGKKIDQFGEKVILPENTIVVGFARRITLYKRWPMLFRNPEKLKKILTENPTVHIIMSGQPHYKDQAAIADLNKVKTIIADDLIFRARIHFFHNWTPDFAKVLIPACHVWLNTPIKGQEACGTSGMKSGLGEALQVSVVDGFYNELPKDSFYAIEGQTDSPEEVNSLYQQLEKAVTDTQNSQKWAQKVKQYWIGHPETEDSGLQIASGARMLAEYTNMALPSKNK